MPRKKNSNKEIWFLFLAFAAPVVLAYYMYFFADIKSFSNHGEILNPIVHIRQFKLMEATGKPVEEVNLTYKWRLIFFLEKDCDEACLKRLYDIRQIYTALGKDRHRVLQMLVHLEPPSKPLQTWLAKTYLDPKRMVEYYADEKAVQEALGANGFIRNNSIYIMDPMGNVMMRFTADQPDKDVLTDLKKLLKASQIG